MNFEINKEYFGMAVPAFKEATDETFAKMYTFLVQMDIEVTEMLGDFIDGAKKDKGITDLVKCYICLSAAHTAVPSLDLKMTSTGFGVVSNTNLAPASRERVMKLEESLRTMVTSAKENLIRSLLATAWANSVKSELYVDSLLFLPSLLSRYGVTYEGKHVYWEEMLYLTVSRTVAEERLKEVISPELHEKLIDIVRHQNAPDAQLHDAAYDLVIEKSRKFMAVLMRNDVNPVAAAALLRSLQQTLKQYEDTLPEYKQSLVNQAKSVGDYENKKDTGCFFFS